MRIVYSPAASVSLSGLIVNQTDWKSVLVALSRLSVSFSKMEEL